jgi:large subunit ribosomal protein L9
MKVLLRENVRKLGQIGEVVDVKPGYARNYLIPHGMAAMPTEANVRAVEAAKAKYLAELAKQREAHQQRADAIDGTEVTISALANVEGQLYGSVGPAQIAAALAEEGHVVEPSEVILEEGIKTLDKYEVTIELAEEITAKVNVWVVPDRESAASMAAAAEEAREAGEEAPDVELSGKVAEVVEDAADSETAVDAAPLDQTDENA